MQAYKYDTETKRYIGIVECQKDPLESKKQGCDIWLLPADSTFVEPLPEKEGFYVVWNGNEWVYDAIPVPPIPPEPTEDELKENVRSIRDGYLSYWDFSQLVDAPFTEDEKLKYREYRQYLRDYTKEDNWWLQNPMTYEEWSVGHHPVGE